MYIPHIPLFKINQLFKKKSSIGISKAPWTARADEHIFVLSKGRWAFEVLLSSYIKSIGKRHGTIYIPEYFCEITLTPLRMSGHNLHFYRITSSFEPDTEHLNTLVERKGVPDIMCYVHYFGFPSKTSDFKSWCDENGALMVEDAAHTMLPIPDIGNNGCPVIYTPWKFLGIPEGALLVLPDPFASNVKQFRPRSDEFFHILKMMGRVGVDYMGLRYSMPIHKFKKQRIKEPDESEPWQDPKIPACGKLSFKMLSLSEGYIEEIRAHRERNYRRLDSIFTNSRISGYRVFKQLPAFFAPYVYPLRVPEKLSRKVMVALNKKGIPAAPWSDLSPEVKNSTEFPLANVLRREVMTLPVHQDITLEKIDRMGAETISTFEVF